MNQFKKTIPTNVPIQKHNLNTKLIQICITRLFQTCV